MQGIWAVKRATSQEERDRLLEESWEPWAIDYELTNGVIVERYWWFKRQVPE